ncbi:hypothetical protein Pmani_002804 [Petrolisthes manimaculis]|uniref:Uncharacterized protein n=1 Tax=Petrolisthes manimaculis TaxID=1843537 RepID=A0AAE1QJQ2_9EUCA|nr:hypothetical protein Pmani_002804 [Petrolisthes manimaculis]
MVEQQEKEEHHKSPSRTMDEAVCTSRVSRVAVVLVMACVLAPLVVMEVAGERCTVMRGDCRLVADLEYPDDHTPFTALNISCECKRGEDVTSNLEQLKGAKCAGWIPSSASDPKVNSSTLYIVGCSIRAKPLPASVLDQLRRTNRLELFVRDSPALRLSPYIHQPESNTDLPQLHATFINSNVSGIPEGVLGNVNEAKVSLEDCRVGVIESRAFSVYPQHASVNITFLNTVITTLKMVAFELPPSSEVTMIGGRVLAWDRSGYAGGERLELRGVTVGRILGYAINLYGLQSFTMTGCTVAELLSEALAYRTLPYGKEMKNNSAVLTGNTFITTSGEAFLNLCFVNDLVWSMNTFANLAAGPLRLQIKECERERNWRKVVTRTDLNCSNCEDFRNPDKQTCAMYETGLCVSCKGQSNSCNRPILSHLIDGPCEESHPDVTEALRTTCVTPSATTAGSRTSRILRGEGAKLIPSALPLVVVVVVVAIGMVINV